MNEFALIRHWFQTLGETRGAMQPDLGIGDDAALVTVPPGKQLAITTDTLIAGVHFPLDTAPADIGYKALAVNLSDLAAMGAVPAWFTLNLSLPEYAADWLDGFCRGLEDLLQQQPITLIGGDTTRGPLSISIQAMGLADSGCALRRSGAQVGDDIYVSGRLGEAGVGLQVVQQKLPQTPPAIAEAVMRLNRPRPRNPLGVRLVSLAHACIDVSDGLLADLQHVLEASGVGAQIHLEQLPVAEALEMPELVQRLNLPMGSASGLAQFAASAGDDFELCFTAAPTRRKSILQAAQQAGVNVTRIGTVMAEPGLFDATQQPLSPAGYRHF